MDAFPSEAIFFLVLFKPGEKPVIALLGQGAQALADQPVQLSSILAKIAVREPLLAVKSPSARSAAAGAHPFQIYGRALLG